MGMARAPTATLKGPHWQDHEIKASPTNIVCFVHGEFPIAWTTPNIIKYIPHNITNKRGSRNTKNIWGLYGYSLFHQAVRPKSGPASSLSPRTNGELSEAES